VAKFIRVKCPHCGRRTEINWTLAKRRQTKFQCPHCGEQFEGLEAAQIAIFEELERQYPGITKGYKP
jgi:predicted RNA-binding Zn-ribbon protein involved in translation (DUF1610 family)